MKFRRYLALVLALAMLLSMAAPALALAEDNPLDLGGELEVTAEGGDIQDVVDAGEIDLSGGAGEAAAETFTVTFMVGDAVYATQTVAKDGYPVQPETAPEAEGGVFAYWHLETEEASDYFASPVAIGSDTVLIAAFTEAEAPAEEQPEQPAEQQPEGTPAEEQPEETPAEEQPEEQPEQPAEEQPEQPAEEQPEETPAEEQPEEQPEQPAEEQPEEQPEETPEQPAETPEQPEEAPAEEEQTEEEQTEVEIPEEPQVGDDVAVVETEGEAEAEPAQPAEDEQPATDLSVEEETADAEQTMETVDTPEMTGYSDGTVAVIGTTEYSSLRTALEAGGDVLLVSNVDYTEEKAVITKTVTLTAAQGYSITTNLIDRFTVNTGGKLTIGENVVINASKGAVFDVEGGEVVIDGGTIYGGSGNATAYVASGSLTVSSGTLKSNTLALSVIGSGTATIEGGLIDSETGTTIRAGSGAYADTNGVITITGGEIKTDSSEYCTAWARNGGKIIVDGGTVTSGGNAALVATAKSSVEVKSGIVGATTGYAVLAHEGNASATIKGGTINGYVGAGSSNNGTGNRLTITGGTINGEIIAKESKGTVEAKFNNSEANLKYPVSSDMVEAGYACTTTPDEYGYYHIVKAVAKIGEKRYATLKDAVTAAASGDTIEMIDDSEEGFFDIPKTANVTVDLKGKDAKLQWTPGSGFGMNVYGKLTIKDTEGDGQFSSDSTTVQSAGDLTICDDVELGYVNIYGGKFSATGKARAEMLYYSGSSKVSVSGEASVGEIDGWSKDAEIAVSETARVDRIWVYGAKVNVSGAPVIENIWLEASDEDGVYSVINVEGGLTSGASICVSTNSDRLLDGPAFITGGLNAASVEDVKKYFSSANAAIELSCLNKEAVLQIKETDWVKLQKLINNAEKGATLKLEQDYAYTEEDVIGDLEVRGKELTIDLNGHAIDAKSSGENALFWDAVITLDDSKLTIKDSKGGGKITGGSEGGIRVWDESAFTMTGGSITGNNGTGVYISDESTFTMTGGEITKNTAKGGNGAGVYVGYGSTFTMTGGSITGNKAVQMQEEWEGEIETWGGQGGGVYVSNNATFNVSGNPTITGNTAENGANVYLYGYQPTTWDSEKQQNVPDGDFKQALITVTGALSGAKIGVTTEAKPSEQDGVVTFTKDYAKYNAGKDPADVFTSDDTKYATGWNDAETEGVLGLEIKTTATGYTGVYDGKAHAGATVTVTAPKSGATVTYSKDGKTYAKDAPTYTDAGEYTVYYKVAAKGYAMKKGTVTARITKAESKVTVTAEGWTYGEAAKTPVVSGYNGDGKITFLYAKAASANGEYAANAGETYGETVPSDAGDYLVKASIAATANYAAVESDPASFTIAKAKLTVVADAKSKTEGEADPELTYTAKGLVGSDKLTGALTRAAGEAVGVYPITIGTLTAGDNYEIAFTGSNLTITAKAQPEPQPAKSKGIFLVTAKASGSKCLKVTWTALKDARVDGYDVFMADCGQDDHGPFELVRSVTAATRSVKMSGLKKQTAYKVMIKAFDIQDGKKVYIGESAQVAHAYTDGGSKSHTNPKSISLNKTKVSLKVGEKFNIKATVKGLKSGKKVLAHGGLVRYVSSDKSVATVSATGRITAVGAGKCKVYAVTANGIYKAVSVTVKGSGTPTGIAFKGSAYSVKKGKTLKLGSQVKLTPSGAKTSLAWKSSDKKIATVDKNGKVKGLKKGTVTITVKTANGLTASVKVKVN